LISGKKTKFTYINVTVVVVAALVSKASFTTRNYNDRLPCLVMRCIIALHWHNKFKNLVSAADVGSACDSWIYFNRLILCWTC